MFKFHELENMQIEITSNCQASCPMCARNHHGGLPNPLLEINSWTLKDFQDIFTREVIGQVKILIIAGCFGDPIINNDLIDMCRYLKEEKFKGHLRIHTNGSARTISWWKQLANSLPDNHDIVFALDGLADTHSLYRIGTNYETIIRNAKAFINNGGNAEWAFIKFKHNQHQVEQAENLANEIGFRKFTVKNSKRFVKETFDVLDDQGKKIYQLEPATDSTVTFFDKKILTTYKQLVADTQLECQAKTKKEIYIDAARHIFPCCYTAAEPYQRIGNDDLYFLKKQSQEEVKNMIKDLGGLIRVDADNSIKKIFSSEAWQTVWDKHLQNKPLVCVSNCGKHSNITTTDDQFIKKINFVSNNE